MGECAALTFATLARFTRRARNAPSTNSTTNPSQEDASSYVSCGTLRMSRRLLPPPSRFLADTLPSLAVPAFSPACPLASSSTRSTAMDPLPDRLLLLLLMVRPVEVGMERPRLRAMVRLLLWPRRGVRRGVMPRIRGGLMCAASLSRFLRFADPAMHAPTGPPSASPQGPTTPSVPRQRRCRNGRRHTSSPSPCCRCSRARASARTCCAFPAAGAFGFVGQVGHSYACSGSGGWVQSRPAFCRSRAPARTGASAGAGAAIVGFAGAFAFLTSRGLVQSAR